MTKSATPPPARSDVVEIEAMDLAEWESGQSTPQTSDANLAELVRRTAATPEAGTRRTPATRERTRTQIGAPIARPPGERARTVPPGPAPRPTRARASVDAVAVPSRVPAATATPVQPAPTASPRSTATGTPAKPAPTAAPRSVATPPGGIDFSLPVTSPGETESPSLPAPPSHGGIDFSLPVTSTGEPTRADPRQPAPPSVEIDFSLPVTSTGETTGSREALTQVRPPSAPGAGSPSGIDFAVPVTASSKSGARRPGSEPPTNAIPSPFAEASRAGPGRNASPPGGPEANTAWPPRPVPVEPGSSADRAALDAMHRPSPEAAEGAERLQVLSRRRLVWIVGAIGTVAVAAVLAAATLGSSSAPPAAQATRRAGAAGRSADAAAARAAASSSDDATAPTSTSGAATTVSRAAALPDPMARAASAQRTWRLAIGAAEGATNATVGPAPRPKRRSGPTKLVIDYRTRPNEPPAAAVVQSEDDPAIASARSAYNRGNQRLFVGDLEGAVRAYQESLDLYPGYVGGYRGLGLAYAELGEKSSALDALKAYVAAAPAARDVALIKKRISRLQGK
jgi:Tetratricopeptide repeat